MSSKRIMDIELLRAIAVLGVLFHHLQGNLFAAPVPLLEAISARAETWWGVDLFFVISGYVIARSLIPVLQGCPSGRQFWSRPAISGYAGPSGYCRQPGCGWR